MDPFSTITIPRSKAYFYKHNFNITKTKNNTKNNTLSLYNI